MESPEGQSHREGGSVLKKVEDLIDLATGQWDTELVQEHFWEEHRAVILAVPTHMDMEDIISWHFDPKGIFLDKC